MTNASRRKANQQRRDVAAAKQTPLHMRGLQYHPGEGKVVSGQLDRADESRKDYVARYPDPPKYATRVGSLNPPIGDNSPLFKTFPTTTAFAESWEACPSWIVYRSRSGRLFAIPGEKRDRRDKDRPEKDRLSGARTKHVSLKSGAVFVGYFVNISRKSAIAAASKQ